MAASSAFMPASERDPTDPTALDSSNFFASGPIGTEKFVDEITFLVFTSTMRSET